MLASRAPRRKATDYWPIEHPGQVWAYDYTGNKLQRFDARVGDVVVYKQNGASHSLTCDIVEFLEHRVRIKVVTTGEEKIIAPKVMHIIRDGRRLT